MRKIIVLLVLLFSSICIFAVVERSPLMSIKKIFIGPMGEGDEVGRFCMLLEAELTRSGFTVVQSADSADATLSGFLVIRQDPGTLASATISLKDPTGKQIFLEDFGPSTRHSSDSDTVKNRALDIAERFRSLRDQGEKNYERALKKEKKKNRGDAPAAPVPDEETRGRIMRQRESMRDAAVSASAGASSNAPSDGSTRERALTQIAPPPPPTQTISLGQTRDEVVAILGQPQKVAQLVAKEILYYPNMKVILLEGKVADVE